MIKVCNPYCGPCAKAHPILEALAEKGIINLQILFTASNDEKDIASKPVRQLLAIAATGDQRVTKEALNHWYTSKKKDYDSFARSYPMNGELVKQSEKINTVRRVSAVRSLQLRTVNSKKQSLAKHKSKMLWFFIRMLFLF